MPLDTEKIRPENIQRPDIGRQRLDESLVRPEPIDRERLHGDFRLDKTSDLAEESVSPISEHTDNFWRGRFTEEERETMEQYPDDMAEKWKMDKAVDLFLADEYKAPLSQIESDPEYYREQYFGNWDIPAEKAYKEALEARGNYDHLMRSGTRPNIFEESREPTFNPRRAAEKEAQPEIAEEEKLDADRIRELDKKPLDDRDLLTPPGATPPGTTDSDEEDFVWLGEEIRNAIRRWRGMRNAKDTQAAVERLKANPELTKSTFPALRQIWGYLSPLHSRGMMTINPNFDELGKERVHDPVYTASAAQTRLGLAFPHYMEEYGLDHPKVMEMVDIHQKMNKVVEDYLGPEFIEKRNKLIEEGIYPLLTTEWFSQDAWNQMGIRMPLLQEIGVELAAIGLAAKVAGIPSKSRLLRTVKLLAPSYRGAQQIRSLYMLTQESQSQAIIKEYQKGHESLREHWENVTVEDFIDEHFAEQYKTFSDEQQQVIERKIEITIEKERKNVEQMGEYVDFLKDPDRREETLRVMGNMIRIRSIVLNTVSTAAMKVGFKSVGSMIGGRQLFSDTLKTMISGVVNYLVGGEAEMGEQGLEGWRTFSWMNPDVKQEDVQFANTISMMWQLGFLSPRWFDPEIQDDMNKLWARRSISMTGGGPATFGLVGNLASMQTRAQQAQAYTKMFDEAGNAVEQYGSEAHPFQQALAKRISRTPDKSLENKKKIFADETRKQQERDIEKAQQDEAVEEQIIEETADEQTEISAARDHELAEIAREKGEEPATEQQKQPSPPSRQGTKVEAERAAAQDRMEAEMLERKDQNEYHKRSFRKAIHSLQQYDGEKPFSEMTNKELADVLGFKTVNNTVKAVREGINEAQVDEAIDRAETVQTPFDEPAPQVEAAVAESPKAVDSDIQAERLEDGRWQITHTRFDEKGVTSTDESILSSDYAETEQQAVEKYHEIIDEAEQKIQPPAREEPQVEMQWEPEQEHERDHLVSKALEQNLFETPNEWRQAIKDKIGVDANPYSSDVDIQTIRRLVLGDEQADLLYDISGREKPKARIAERSEQRRRMLSDRAVANRFQRLTEMVNKFRNALPGLRETKIVSRVADIPEQSRQRIQKLLPETSSIDYLQAAIDGDDVYLVAENIDSDAKGLAYWLFHEQVVHAGLRNTLGAEKADALFNDIYSEFSNEIENNIPSDYKHLSNHEKAEEYLARLSERILKVDDLTHRELNVWQRMVQWFRDLMSSVFGRSVDLLTDRVMKQGHLTQVESQRLAGALRDGIRGLQAEPEAVPEQTTRMRMADDWRKGIGQRRSDPRHLAAVTLARDIIHKRDVDQNRAKGLLSPHGMEAHSVEALAQAHRIADNVRARQETFRDDAQLTKALEQHELLEHYQHVSEQMMEAARKDEALQAKAQEALQQRSREAQEKRVKLARPLQKKKLQEYGIDPDTEFQNVYSEQGEFNAEALGKMQGRIQDAVREDLIKQERLDENRVDFRKDPAFVEAYKHTWANVLRDAAQDRVASNAREKIMVNIKNLERRKKLDGIERHIGEIMQIINYLRTVEKADTLIGKIDSFLKKSPKSLVETKLLTDRVIAPDVERFFTFCQKAFKAKRKEVESRIHELDDQLGDTETTKDSAELSVMRDELLAYQLFGNTEDKTPAELAEALHILKNQYIEGKNQIAEYKEIRHKRLENLRRIVLNSLTPRPGKKTVHYEPAKARGAIQDYLTGMLSLHNLLEELANYSTQDAINEMRELSDEIRSEWNRAALKQQMIERRISGEFVDFINELTGRNYDSVMRDYYEANPALAKFSIIFRDGEDKYGHEIPWTKKNHQKGLVPDPLQGTTDINKAQLMQMVATLRQADYPHNDKQEVRAEMLPEMEKFLTQQDEDIIAWMQKHYQDNWEPISETFFSLAGLYPKRGGSDYVPVKMETQEPSDGAQIKMEYRIFPKNLIARVKGERDINQEASIFFEFKNHLFDMSHFTSFGELSMDMRDIFLDRRVLRQMRDTHGGAWQSMFRDLILTAGQNKMPANKRDALLDKTRSLFITLKLAGNVPAAVRQMSSVPAFGFEVGMGNVLSNTASFFTPSGLAMAHRMYKHPYFQTRFKYGFSEPIMNALAGENPRHVSRLYREWGFMPMRVMDLMAMLPVGQGIVRSYMQAYMSENQMDSDKAFETAMDRFATDFNATQQSGKIFYLSHYQLHRGSMWRAAGTFAHTLRQYAAYEVGVMRELKAGKPGSLRKMGNVAFLNHLVLPSMFQGLTVLMNLFLGRQPNEDDLKVWLARMLAGPASGLFFFGGLLNLGAHAITGSPYARLSGHTMPLTGIENDLASTARLLNAIYKTDNEAIGKAFNNLARAGFAPWRTIDDARKNWGANDSSIMLELD